MVVVDASSAARSYGQQNNALVIDSIIPGNYLLGPAGDALNTSSITAGTLSTLATQTSKSVLTL